MAFLFALRPEDVIAGKVRWSDFPFRRGKMAALTLLIRAAGKSAVRMGDTIFPCLATTTPKRGTHVANLASRWVTLWSHFSLGSTRFEAPVVS